MPFNISRSFAVAAVLLAASLATGAVAIGSQPGRPAARAAVVNEGEGGTTGHGATPILRKGPKTVEIAPDRPTEVTLTGERFEAGASIILTGLFYMSTVGPDRLSSTSLVFNAAGLADGTYAVTVHNPAGPVSNELMMTISRR